MKNTAVLNLIDTRRETFEPLNGGRSAVEAVLEYTLKVSAIADVTLLCSSAIPEMVLSELRVIRDFTLVVKNEWTATALFEAFIEAGRNYDNVLYLYGDCPLMDAGITNRMLDNHRKYFAEYTFADGYPLGMAPEILKVSILPVVCRLAEGIRLDKQAVFNSVKKDINAFDIETEISPVDLRYLRLDLNATHPGDRLVTRNILAAGGVDEASTLRIIEEKPELLRTRPFYYTIQIVDGCPHSCSYCPYPGIFPDHVSSRNSMPVEKFRGILSKIDEFSKSAVISLSLWGEPALHPAIVDLVKAVLEYDGFRLLIETTGIGWSRDTVREIAAIGGERIDWIISLDTHMADEYASIRGEGFEEAMDFAEMMIRDFHANSYVQAVRTTDNEAGLDQFFKQWKAKTENIIIQKYDWFCGTLPQKKVTDLSPVVRRPCWHIKRDMVIRLDGTVPMCREVLDDTYLWGNIFSQEIAEIWEAGTAVYQRHIAGEYPDICGKCDEYYTYNF